MKMGKDKKYGLAGKCLCVNEMTQKKKCNIQMDFSPHSLLLICTEKNNSKIINGWLYYHLLEPAMESLEKLFAIISASSQVYTPAAKSYVESWRSDCKIQCKELRKGKGKL